MILLLFEEDYQYFPSLREIRDGLMRAQMKIIDSLSDEWRDKSKVEQLKELYVYEWSFLFDYAELGDVDKPLTPKIL